jgi:hypothetical protein
MRWLTAGPVGRPGTSIVPHPPAAGPGVTEEERRTITEMMAKDPYAGIDLTTTDLDATFERSRAVDAGRTPGGRRPASRVAEDDCQWRAAGCVP